jgi:putative ABC transport system permease protein
MLVCCEVALSLMLLIGAGLLLKSFTRLQTVSAGFETDNLLLATISLPQSKYSTNDDVHHFYEDLSASLNNLPGVKSFSAVNATPLSALNNSTEFTVAGNPPKSPSDIPVAQNRWVGPQYFSTMAIPIIKGREFTDRDTSTSQTVVVIDSALARRFFPNQEPLGKHIMIGYAGASDPHDAEIVGVVGNVKHVALEEDWLPTVYACFYQIPRGAIPLGISNRMTLVVRTAYEPLNLSTAVRRAIRATDPDIPTTSVRTMEQQLESTIAPRRFNALLLTIFSISALFLAASGVYAVVSYLTAQSVTEIGIRMSLGARPGDIMKLMAGKGLRPVFLGVVIGLVGAILTTRVISTLLFDVSALDPYVFAAVPIGLLAVALLAVYIPARRAVKVDPLTALRQA